MNLIDGLFSGGGLPLLEKTLRFTEARHRRLLDNIANADTPGYRRRDLSAGRFSAELQQAIRAQESGRAGAPSKPFNPEDFDEAELTGKARSILKILERRDSGAEGVLRHDGNNVDIDREMALLVQNASRFNQVINLFKKQLGEIQMAISERLTA